MNNKAWEYKIPKLEKFTHVANKIGYKVIYRTHPNFPGILLALLFKENNDGEYKQLMIDPNLIFGDTLRIITMDNSSGDIRKESFIPISQENIIVKAIKGTLTKDDRKKLNERLPRCINDYREGYCFLDRVDLRGINTDGRQGMPFDQWRQLIINISNVLKDERIPLCRFRLIDVKSPTQFIMICDDQVLAVYMSPIYTESSHIDSATKRLWVDYDETKYEGKDKNYVIGYTIFNT